MSCHTTQAIRNLSKSWCDSGPNLWEMLLMIKASKLTPSQGPRVLNTKTIQIWFLKSNCNTQSGSNNPAMCEQYKWDWRTYQPAPAESPTLPNTPLPLKDNVLPTQTWESADTFLHHPREVLFICFVPWEPDFRLEITNRKEVASEPIIQGCDF